MALSSQGASKLAVHSHVDGEHFVLQPGFRQASALLLLPVMPLLLCSRRLLSRAVQWLSKARRWPLPELPL